MVVVVLVLVTLHMWPKLLTAGKQEGGGAGGTVIKDATTATVSNKKNDCGGAVGAIGAPKLRFDEHCKL